MLGTPPLTQFASSLDRSSRIPYSQITSVLKRDAVDREPDARLFELRQLAVEWDKSARTLWTFMRPEGRPCYNPDLLSDFQEWQALIRASFDGGNGELRYLVLGSTVPGVFCLGGDLKYFTGKIRDKDRAALVQYGRSCVNILHRNLNALQLPIITIGLAQGDALGGGLESLLSFDVIVAERGAKFGLPENLFGLFPGMGATSILARRVGVSRAAEMILHGEMFTAEELHEWGVVHVLAEPGQGVEAVKQYIARNTRRHKAHLAVYKSFRLVNPISLIELEQIVDLWAEAALGLTEHDLRVMERLVAAQDRLRSASLSQAG
jgi:DSF synthase